MIRLLIVDDHKMFRDGLVALLGTQEGFDRPEVAADGREAIRKAADMDFDAVLLDINMPGTDGLTAATQILAHKPEARIIFLSMFNDLRNIQAALRTGAKGYLLKDSSREDLLEGIRKVVDGETYFVDEVKNSLVRSYQSPGTVDHVRLTAREKDILLLICDEMTTGEIAEKLFISTHTVETHRKNLLAKTGAKSSVGLVRFAIDNKLIR